MRHRDVLKCPIGALGLYLLARVEFGKENWEDINWSRNSDWFDIKLLVNHNADNESNSNQLSERNYAKSMEKACTELNINSDHFIHFGRKVGAMSAEINEIPNDIIKQLGNWNPDVREDRYHA